MLVEEWKVGKAGKDPPSIVLVVAVAVVALVIAVGTREFLIHPHIENSRCRKGRAI